MFLLCIYSICKINYRVNEYVYWVIKMMHYKGDTARDNISVCWKLRTDSV
jgi:hypothetical protein